MIENENLPLLDQLQTPTAVKKDKRLFRCWKRFFDVVFCTLFIILFCWLYGLLALSIKIEDPEGPALFKQKRLGRDGRIFDFYKFRSMHVNSEHTGSGVYSDDEDPRITKVGNFLRKSSLDELPQLFNIIKGDMSLIGPRPPLTYHPWPIEDYSDFQRRMFEVRPGITGWAQINGRKDVEWNHRIELNVWYVDNMSFLLDMKIFFTTFAKVFGNADNQNKGATVTTTTNASSEKRVS